MRGMGIAFCLLVAFSASTRGDDLAEILGPGQTGETRLEQTAVIVDRIANAHAVYPAFGRLPGSPGKDLFLGLRVAGRDDKRGRLRVFPNRGTGQQPRYDEGYWLDDITPSARIPSG